MSIGFIDTAADASATPEAMLRAYRENASPEVENQARKFRGMPDKSQKELLFYMLLHVQNAIMELCGAEPGTMDEVIRAQRGDA
jgi:hypothetical protein